MASVETQKATITESQTTHESIEGLSGRIIDQFINDMGLTGLSEFTLVKHTGDKVTYLETPREEKKVGTRRLAVFEVNETASATAYSDGKQLLGWHRRGIENDSEQDIVRAGEKMTEMLAKFIPKPEERVEIPLTEGVQGIVPIQ